MMKSPLAELVTRRCPWSAGDDAVTATSDSGSDDASTTRPRMVPVGLPCARTDDGNAATNAAVTAKQRAAMITRSNVAMSAPEQHRLPGLDRPVPHQSAGFCGPLLVMSNRFLPNSRASIDQAPGPSIAMLRASTATKLCAQMASRESAEAMNAVDASPSATMTPITGVHRPTRRKAPPADAVSCWSQPRVPEALSNSPEIPA